ncbi:hypothetical protein CR513_44940, partial [Mucuna pruriens]
MSGSATTSGSDLLPILDPEIEITLRRLRKVRNTVVSASSSSNSSSNFDNSIYVTNDFDFSKYNSSNINPDSNFVVSKSQEPKQMENNNQTLKELATPDVVYQPWCIQYPQL